MDRNRPRLKGGGSVPRGEDLVTILWTLILLTALAVLLAWRPLLRWHRGMTSGIR